jgi:glycosyltransferase involved in cell wall biosynthesis
MRVSGFTMVRDGVRFDFPFREAITSILPIVDEFIVNVGDCSDGTREAVEAIASPKIRVFESVWDPEMRRGGEVLAYQTNLALDRCTGDWCFYIQADEVVHEEDLERVANAMRRYLPKRRVEGLTFRYRHFRASYDIRDPLSYRKQVRIVRNGVGIRSVKDACGFAREGRRLRARPTGAWMYHYGWVRSPEAMGVKRQKYSHFFWDSWGKRKDPPPPVEEAKPWEFNLAACVPYRGKHPAVMAERIGAKDWETPPFKGRPRWRNPAWWLGMLKKNVPWMFADRRKPKYGERKDSSRD